MVNLDDLQLQDFAGGESDVLEYKSGRTKPSELVMKLSAAASAFWNSGGGRFVAGVDNSGVPDGRIPDSVGRQPIAEWIDQVLHRVHPVGTYSVRSYAPEPLASIRSNHCVLVVQFDKSAQLPHMAQDHRYYIRAGAHTLPAAHFVVEALWSRRGLSHPVLRHSFRLKPDDPEVVQLELLALTAEPALDVEFALDPLPMTWRRSGKGYFPITIPIVDQQHPFVLDLVTWAMAGERLGSDVRLRAAFKDRAGNHFEYEAPIEIENGLAPWRMGGGHLRKGATALEKISKSLEKLLSKLG